MTRETVRPAGPDWLRLGARFGEADVCVAFDQPGRVYVRDAAGARLVAERVVALRESATEVRVQVECGLVLEIPGVRLDHVDGRGHVAHLAVGARRARRRR